MVKEGIEENRISTMAKGEMGLLVSFEEEQESLENRRVEFVLDLKE